MKLNNKGFAFSTMLYGTLALITVILYVILGINQGSKDEMLFYGEEIQKKLNECVFDEIQLENCYSSHNGYCNATSYHACLGISDNNEGTMGELIAETLKSKTGVVQDPLIERRYIYRGNTVNNYLKFSGKTWRILSIEPDGSIKLLDYTYNSEAKVWDSSTTSNWESSTLRAYLNNNYLPTIADISKLTSSKWQAVILSNDFDNTIATYNTLATNNDETISSFSIVGLPSLYDYIIASANNDCRNDMEGTGIDCSSWLSQYKGWTINKASNNKVIEFNQMTTTYTTTDATQTRNYYPIITLNRNNYIKSGSGTASDPYELR